MRLPRRPSDARPAAPADLSQRLSAVTLRGRRRRLRTPEPNLVMVALLTAAGVGVAGLLAGPALSSAFAGSPGQGLPQAVAAHPTPTPTARPTPRATLGPVVTPVPVAPAPTAVVTPVAVPVRPPPAATPQVTMPPTPVPTVAPPPTAVLQRWFSPPVGGHWIDVLSPPATYNFEFSLARIYTVPVAGTQPLYSCLLNGKQFISLLATCEGQPMQRATPIGWVYSTAPNNSVVGIYRCVAPNLDLFVSRYPSCEGTVSQGLLGFALP